MKTVIFLISILLSSVFVNAQDTMYHTMHIQRNNLTWVEGGPFGFYYVSDSTYTHTQNWASPITCSTPISNGYIYGASITNPHIGNYYVNTLTFKLINRYFVSGTYYSVDTSSVDTAYVSWQVTISSGNYIIYYLTVIIDPAPLTTVFETVNMSSIEVYPNPFTDNVNLKINALESSKTSVMLIDMLGKVYENKEVEILAGENNINIPVNCPSGIYFLSFVLDNETITYKIVK